jgi:hypothetical protein
VEDRQAAMSRADELLATSQASIAAAKAQMGDVAPGHRRPRYREAGARIPRTSTSWPELRRREPSTMPDRLVMLVQGHVATLDLSCWLNFDFPNRLSEWVLRP